MAGESKRKRGCIDKCPRWRLQDKGEQK